MYFQTEKIELRPFESGDSQALQAYLNHPELSGRRYLPREFPDGIPLSSKQVEALIKQWGEGNNEAHLAIILSENGELIGHADIEWGWDPHSPWISVVIAPPYQHQGYGSQALRQILSYLFESTIAHNVSGWMADWDQAARAFASKHGFQESGRSRREGIRKGKYYDSVLVDILRPEWVAKQEK
jgi:RimJ/RimL family protein N-acetyltransferase